MLVLQSVSICNSYNNHPTIDNWPKHSLHLTLTRQTQWHTWRVLPEIVHSLATDTEITYIQSILYIYGEQRQSEVQRKRGRVHLILWNLLLLRPGNRGLGMSYLVTELIQIQDALH